MTREDARTPIIALIHMINGGAAVFKNIDGTANVIIDQFVDLGMLKLDEPKSVQDRAVDAIRAHKELYTVRPICVFDALDYAGLKIVEK